MQNRRIFCLKFDSILMARCYEESQNISFKTHIKIRLASMAIYITQNRRNFPFKTRIHRVDIKMLHRILQNFSQFKTRTRARVARCYVTIDLQNFSLRSKFECSSLANSIPGYYADLQKFFP